MPVPDALFKLEKLSKTEDDGWDVHNSKMRDEMRETDRKRRREEAMQG